MSGHSITFTVDGIPVPEGSTTAYRRPGGRVVVTHANKRLDAWRAQVRAAALAAAREQGWTLGYDGPVTVAVSFLLPRPERPSVSPVWAATKPDLDKLCRAVGDAITQVRRGGVVTAEGLLREDSRIVLWTAVKLLTRRTPHAEITVGALENKEKP